jgi:uncharacterized protein (TIGR02271 family)
VISTEQLEQVVGNDVVDSTGSKVGTARQVYLDDTTGQPAWVTVRTGLFGSSESFVPVADASVENGQLRVPYAKDQIKDAPRVDDDGHLSPEQESELYRYYGLGDGHGNERTGPTETEFAGETAVTGTRDRAAGYDTSGPTTDDAMTRSEEQLHVGTEKVQTGRARLRKHVISEQQQVTVPVSREEVRVEREPITDANVGAAMNGPELSEEEHEVVLTEERPVVAKETVPVERVRLAKEAVTEEKQVTADVRKEQIETEGDLPGESGL